VIASAMPCKDISLDCGNVPVLHKDADFDILAQYTPVQANAG